MPPLVDSKGAHLSSGGTTFAIGHSDFFPCLIWEDHLGKK